MRNLLVIGSALIAVVFVSIGFADAADYVVDPSRSELVVRLSKGGVAAAVAHNHVIRAAEFAGEAVFDPEDLAHATLRVEAQVISLVADEPDARRRYGLSKSISEKDREKIQETMLSAGQMDVDSYPVMEFRSTSVEGRPEGQYLMTGKLAIHGVERMIAFPITLEEEDGGLRGRAEIGFKQSDFGIKPFSAMLGAVRNKDEAVLYIDIFAAPAERRQEED